MAKKTLRKVSSNPSRSRSPAKPSPRPTSPAKRPTSAKSARTAPRAAPRAALKNGRKPKPVSAPTTRAMTKSIAKPAAKPAVKKKAAATATAGRVNGASAGAVLLPPRSAVPIADTWDLTPLFTGEPAWDAAFKQATAQLEAFKGFAGRLGDGPAVLRQFFDLDNEFSRLCERLANYASLRTSQDQTDQSAQAMRSRYQHLATQAAEVTAYFRPELLALPQATLDAYLAAPELADFRISLEHIVRYRPHTLSKAEERLLAMQGQMASAAGQIFRQLNDADLKFGLIADETGRSIELGHASFSSLLQSPSREVRRAAFHQYYSQYQGHRNTIAATLAGSVHRDVYEARARNFATAREASLFADDVPTQVYDNLVSTVRSYLPTVHRYLELRRRAMKLPDLHHYDTYVPILADLKKHHTWEQAADVVCRSLEPLGSEYVGVLHEGLTAARWADRYPNAGKRSGAFSSGCFDSPPYILMNFQPDVLEHVFTLTHEAGHSMHTWYSARNQPYQYWGYTIFVAEVASTFNEQLLARHLMDHAASDRERAYLINRQIDGIRGTIIRQTMFAEFERDIHAMAEAGEPLTLESLRSAYRRLLTAYFGVDQGSSFVLDEDLELECLRIPHFYSAFYVYKYATGLSAAIALSQRVLAREPGALDQYLGFLKSGGSKFPLDLLKAAGVDMSTPTPIAAALTHFDHLVTELDSLV